jgi:uncharacterized protein YjbI with pentapeptide repeats
MDFVNESGLEAAWIVGHINPPAPSLTALVKGTFRLRPGAAAVLAEEQARLTGDQFEADDPSKLLRYPSDFAPAKPRADVLLVGTCFAAREPVAAARVGMRLGAFAKVLVVYGDRQWTSNGVPTEPTPFSSMPLSWARTYGGLHFPRNPLGRGAQAEGSAIVPGSDLPNIEYPDRPLRSPDRGEAAGFGPIPDSWPQRLQKFGRFDDEYLKDRWPLPPRDMNWGFFNAAPEDQQLDGFVRGDEELYFENLHPAIPHYRSQLPGVRVRCFVNERQRAQYRLREIQMRLDTVWVDMDAETLVLVWRGHVELRSSTLIGSEHFFVFAEELSDPPRDEAQCLRLLEDALARREIVDDELDAEDEPEENEDEEDEGEEEEEEREEEAAAPRAERAQPSPLPLLATAPVAAPQTDALSESDVPPAEPLDGVGQVEEGAGEAAADELPAPDEVALTAARVLEMAAAHASFAGCDLSGLNLSGADLSGLDFRDAIMGSVCLVEAKLVQANLAGAMLAGANLRHANCAGASFAGADLTGAWLTGADLSSADLGGADLTRARLRLARLPSVHARDAIFAGADASDASFQGADLTATDFCEARIHRTDFSNANLTDAALEDAWGRHVNGVGATLIKLRGAGAVLCEADFSHCFANESVWEAAHLFRSTFGDSVLDGAEFSSAYLCETTFDASEMKGARLNQAALRSARLRRCNCLEASFDEADLTDADVSESNLFGASLIDTVTQATVFAGANLRRVKNREVT